MSLESPTTAEICEAFISAARHNLSEGKEQESAGGEE